MQTKWEKYTPNKGRIIGGFNTTIERIPWQIALHLSGRYLCGGSILSATRVLTAAHCVNPSTPAASYFIQAGSTSRAGDPTAVRIPLVRHIRHPHYNPRTIQNDVAVLSLARRLQFGPRIQRIGLPGQGTSVPAGATAFVSGW